MTECEHLSATGIDRTEGPGKVWRCDGCGWLHRSIKGDDGLSRMVPVDAPVPAAFAWPTNGHLIADVHRLGYITDDDRVLDPTYGLGRWWTQYRPPDLVAHDLNPRKAPDGRSIDFTRTPYPPGSFDVVAFDPPYKLNGTSTEAVDDQYGVAGSYVPWQERHDLIEQGIDHLATLLRIGGRLLLKCQDQVCSGAVRWQTIEFVNHAHEPDDEGVPITGLRLVDRFDMLGTSRPQPSGRAQHHAHGRPSTLLVFEQTVDHRQGRLM